MRAHGKPTTTQLDAEKAIKEVPPAHVSQMVEKLANRAGMQEYLKKIDIKPLMDEVRQSMKHQPENLLGTHVNIKARAYSMSNPLLQEFNKEVNQILGTVEFKTDLERMLAPYVSQITGHYPNEVVDMDVSNGSSPDEPIPCSSTDLPPPAAASSSSLMPPRISGSTHNPWPPLIPPTLALNLTSAPPPPPPLMGHPYYRR